MGSGKIDLKVFFFNKTRQTCLFLDMQKHEILQYIITN